MLRNVVTRILGEQMRAGWYESCGAAEEVFQISDVPNPVAKNEEILVRLHTSGINPSDYKRRANVKAGVEFPRVIPHSDGAGVVAALGTDTSGFKIGDRVWVFGAQWGRPFGTAAEFVSLPAAQVRPLPDEAGFEEGACLGIPAMTAYRSVFANGPVNGQTVYIPAALGRVGAYAVQLAKWGGAHVIANASGPEKCAMARALGAYVCLDRLEGDLEGRLMAETRGRGVDRVIEIDFPGNLAINERIVADGGGIASYGAASAPQVSITLAPRRARNLSLQFVFVYSLRPDVIEETCAGVLRAQTAGALQHRIAGSFPLSELAKAHKFAETQSGTGHVIVRTD
jgi:NADPH2:quinone reductase